MAWRARGGTGLHRRGGGRSAAAAEALKVSLADIAAEPRTSDRAGPKGTGRRRLRVGGGGPTSSLPLQLCVSGESEAGRKRQSCGCSYNLPPGAGSAVPEPFRSPFLGQKRAGDISTESSPP
ncbi:uncharacterized protein ACOB8E_019490 isoform 1-T6 [Sarcophilus harrisii]